MTLYTDGQIFESKKESYISIVNEQNEVTLFSLIGFKSVRETEGTAILKALEYFQEHNVINGTIYTDSLDWAGIANGNHRVNAATNNDAFELASKVLTLKEELLTTIHWKRRELNLAGLFLAKIWRMKKEEIDKVLTDLSSKD